VADDHDDDADVGDDDDEDDVFLVELKQHRIRLKIF